MAAEKDQLPPIEPLHEHWEPNPVPANIEVPGLDTSAPVQDQIEQIEQLITIKLQNIDANFARAHQILSTRILPAVKRYAVNTEPVRDAARFWVSFYEQAAQVRIPTTEDFSGETQHQATASDEEMEVEQPQAQEEKPRPKVFDPNMTPSESSFAPENAAVSSTPMPNPSERPREENAEVQESGTRGNSMHSPLKRLNEGLKSLREERRSVVEDSRQSIFSKNWQSVRSEASANDSFVFRAPEKGKMKAPPTPVFSRAARGKDKEQKPASPFRMKKTPKKNPYVPPNIPPADWDGIVDLTKPVTPRRGPSSTADWTSEEEDFPPRGVSPPRSAFGKRIAAQIGRTPVREAAARIGLDLVGDAERLQLRYRVDNAAVDSTLTSTNASSPSVSRFTKQAMGIESANQSSTASQAREDTASRNARLDLHPGVRAMIERYEWEREHGIVSGDPESSSDSTDGGPIESAFPFLLNPPDDAGADTTFEDSFDQMDAQDDSLGDGDWGGEGGSFSFDAGQADETYDESMEYDDDRRGNDNEEPTVFGSQHIQRLGAQLQLLGRGLVDDTTALNSRLRRNVDPETPTPWMGGAQGDGL